MPLSFERGVLIVAVPVDNVTSTLDQLIILELLVTGGALVGAVLLGLWLVRVGLSPLRDVVRTAEAISAGDLMHRVPNENERTEVGHVAIALNVMLEQIQLPSETFRSPRIACAVSFPTPRTNCEPRSPQSRPTRSSSSTAASTRRTSPE